MDVCKSMRNYSEKFVITQMGLWVRDFFPEMLWTRMFPFFFAPQGIFSCFAIHLVLYKEKPNRTCVLCHFEA